MKGFPVLGSCALVTVLALPGLSPAEQPPAPRKVGIVTAIRGQASVARLALPQPVALRFKDDVFPRDQISTREQSSVRLLLGGRATVSVRELSRFTIEETVPPDGGRRSVLRLLGGKIGAAIARGLMRPGDAIEVRTPDAVAAVRGTVLIAEYIPPRGRASAPGAGLLASAAPGPDPAQAAIGGTSRFFVLSGSVVITPRGQVPLTLGPMQGVRIVATPAGPQAGPVSTLSPAEAAQVVQDLRAGKPHTGEPDAGKNLLLQLAVAQSHLNLQPAVHPLPPASNSPAGISSLSTSGTPNNTVAPVVPRLGSSPADSSPDSASGSIRAITPLPTLKNSLSTVK